MTMQLRQLTPQGFDFTNLSEACCEAKRWKHLTWVSVN
jgi:hypothetical protein